MKAKDKAYQICLAFSNIWHDRGNFTKQVKQCALMLADEMIHSAELRGAVPTYWIQVKAEIELL